MVGRDSLNRALWKAWWLGCGLAVAVFSARAEAPPPPAEFWNYLLEYGDANGDLFDPSDLAVAAHVQEKNTDAEKAGAESSAAENTSATTMATEKSTAAEKSTASGQPIDAGAVEHPREHDPATALVAPGERSE